MDLDSRSTACGKDGGEKGWKDGRGRRPGFPLEGIRERRRGEMLKRRRGRGPGFPISKRIRNSAGTVVFLYVYLAVNGALLISDMRKRREEKNTG